jgi:hypothetical protein
MINFQNIINFIFKLFIVSVVMFISSSANQRVIDEKASKMPQIPLMSAMGKEAYDDAIGSGKYRFVGSSKCRLCHREFFLGRKQDLHDSAMESLASTGDEKNAHCLTCHSTGYGIESGFVDMESTPRLSNVECEGCHGPGNVHIELAKDKNKVKRFERGGFLAGQDNPERLKKMCTSCHTQRWNKSYHDLTKSYNSYKKADPNSRYK